jgi:glycerol-1-phosphate dehydrogenase [NAD(P)+]
MKKYGSMKETAWKKILSKLEPPAMLLILPGKPAPFADDKLVTFVKARLATADCIAIAFGTGTINDVVKRASFELGRPYICIPTAPSVDGFAASGAAIFIDGFKTTLECPPPQILFEDTDMLCRAPKSLLAAGFGDMMAKLTAGLDWMIADALGIEPINKELWNLIQPTALALLHQGSLIKGGNPEAIMMLYDGLVSSGKAMREYGDSRPASGAEHLLSHAWEMLQVEPHREAIYHGYQVAIGTLAVASMMEEIFSMNAWELKKCIASNSKNLFEERLVMAKTLIPPGSVRERTIAVIQSKTPCGDDLNYRHERLLTVWDDLAYQMKKRLPPFEVLRHSLAEAGCPVCFAEIGLTENLFKTGIQLASLIRKRYTILDLAAELNLLELASIKAASMV